MEYAHFNFYRLVPKKTTPGVTDYAPYPSIKSGPRSERIYIQRE